MDRDPSVVAALPLLEREELFERMEMYQGMRDVIGIEDIQWINRCVEALLLFGADSTRLLDEQVNFLTLCLELRNQSFLSFSLETGRALFNILDTLRAELAVEQETEETGGAALQVLQGGR